MEPLKVVFIAGDSAGPAYHDIHVPIKYYHKFGLLECLSLEQTVGDGLKAADIVVFQRQYAPESLMLIRSLKKAGKVCIFIVDDNVWNLPKANPAHPIYQGLILDRYEAILEACDAVHTSTQYLRSKAEKFNNNIYVLRNLVETFLPEFLAPGRDNPEEIRIGWTGTPHHHDDIQIVESALDTICHRYPNVKLVFMGYAAPNLVQRLKKNRFEYYGFIPVDAYYPGLANLDFDIGYAPLDDNLFNRGKTARKAQEYGILGIPMILSPLPTYEDWSTEVNCLKPLRNKYNYWVDCFTRLIENPTLRNQLAKSAYEYVVENHDVNKFIFERAQTFYDIYNKAKGTHLEMPIVEVDHD